MDARSRFGVIDQPCAKAAAKGERSGPRPGEKWNAHLARIGRALFMNRYTDASQARDTWFVGDERTLRRELLMLPRQVATLRGKQLVAELGS